MEEKINNEMQVIFKSKSVNESFARVVVESFVSQLDPTIEEIADIKTAVSEAVTNSIVHGYKNLEGDIKIKARLLEEKIVIEIIDNGEGIENVEEARKPLFTSMSGKERSGMGFTIMESFMDEIKVESILGMGTKILMSKKLKKSNT